MYAASVLTAVSVTLTMSHQSATLPELELTQPRNRSSTNVTSMASYWGKPPCRSDEDAAYPQSAGGSICMPRCTSTDDCPSSHFGAHPLCSFTFNGEYHCELECVTSSDCPQGASCVFDLHRSICTYGVAARWGRPPCRNDEDLVYPPHAGGSICMPRCDDDNDCPRTSLGAEPLCKIGNPNDMHCELQCDDDGDCPSGAACKFDTYRYICTYGPSPLPTLWPSFSDASDLQASGWGDYFKAMYGEIPDTGYPINLFDFWVFHNGAILDSPVFNIPRLGSECPPDGDAVGMRYSRNSIYVPSRFSWSWHKYPYSAVNANTWIEVLHQADPFNDEKIGAWFVMAPGSGISFYTGNSIAFQEHIDAYNYFGVRGGNWNEEMCRAAAARGYDSIQFLAHVDHTSYPCDTGNTGNPGLQYMNVEIVATKLVGTYACTSAHGAPSVIRAGWKASRECRCSNTQKYINCAGVPAWSGQGLGTSTTLPSIAV